MLHCFAGCWQETEFWQQWYTKNIVEGEIATFMHKREGATKICDDADEILNPIIGKSNILCYFFSKQGWTYTYVACKGLMLQK